MTTISAVLRANPELALFLALALGFLIGRVKIGTFSFGPVLGTLFAGVLVGQTGVAIPGPLKVVFFDLFLFATGYKVGPQFFRGLKKDALPQLGLTVVICVASLLTAVALSRLLGYDVGTAAGLLAGARRPGIGQEDSGPAAAPGAAQATGAAGAGMGGE